MRRIMILLFVLGLPAPGAAAAQWHVDQSAAAGGDGSAGAPFQTINAVRDVLQTGDTVWIYDGVYHETVDFWHVPEGVGGRTVISAAPGHQPVIEGDGSRDFAFQAGETPGMTFWGLTVRDTDGTAFHFYYADDGEVLECRTDNVSGAVSFYFSSRGLVYLSDLYGGISGKQSDGTVIEASRVHHSQAEGITLHADSRNLRYLNNVVHDNHSVNIYIDSASNVIVDGNLVFMTDTPPQEMAGIQLADESYDNVTEPKLQNIVITNNVLVNNDYGIVFWDGHFPGESAMRNVTIANNTIVNNLRLAIVWDPGPHQDTVIRNNIFAADGLSGAELLLNAKSVDGVVLDHNLWYLPGVSEYINWGGGELFDHAGWVATSGQGEGDVLADPDFVGAWDLTADAYRLAAGSPAIDTGAPVVGLDIDFDRAGRPAGDGYEIGAFEHGASPNPDGGVPALPDAGDLPPDGDADAAGCGCQGTPGHPNAGALLPPLLLPLLLLVGRRRRRD